MLQAEPLIRTLLTDKVNGITEHPLAGRYDPPAVPRQAAERVLLSGLPVVNCAIIPGSARGEEIFRFVRSF